MKNIMNTFVFLLLCFQLIAQPGKGKQSWNDSYQIAQGLLAESSYYNATEYLVKALELKGTDDVGLIYLIAKTYKNARDYENAAYYYNLTLKHDTEGKYKDARWNYALMLKQQGDYDKAICQFRFLVGFNNSKSDLIENEIEGCQLAISGIESEIISIKEVAEVNTAYTEYAPMPLKDGGFIYSSLHSNDLIYTHKKMVYSKIFETAIVDGNISEKGSPMSDVINQSDFHNGHGTYSDDGKRFYFTRCETKSDHNPECKIYASSLRGGEWSEAILLGFNINGNSTASNPYFKNGFLYFSTDRTGGEGGLDIWMAKANEDGSFAPPTNLGRHVNTERDEITPFFDDQDDVLYFSSNGHVGYGGFDILKSVKKNEIWMAITNLYQPINSSADDMYFALDASSENAYFSSNRAGAKGVDNSTCCDDIFMVRLSDEIKNISVEGFAYVQGSPNRTPVDDAKIELYEVDEIGNLTLIDTWMTKDQDPYQFNIVNTKEYVIKAFKDPHEPGIEMITPRGTSTIHKDIALGVKDCIELSGYVYQDDSKEKKIVEGAMVRLIEVNEYGEEIVVSQAISTINGYVICAPKDKKMKMIITKDGALTDSYIVNTNGVTGPEEFDIILRSNEMNIAFRIDNILYDFNSSILRKESEIELNKIYKIMILNPSIILEIGSHTDNKGSVDYNLTLSQKRAKSAVNYLVSRGIPTARLKAEGYGELVAVAPNRHPDGTDNPEGRQLNRRTEFKIIGKVNNDSVMSQK